MLSDGCVRLPPSVRAVHASATPFRSLPAQPSAEEPFFRPFDATPEQAEALREVYAPMVADALYGPLNWNASGTARKKSGKPKSLSVVLPGFLNQFTVSRILSERTRTMLIAGAQGEACMPQHHCSSGREVLLPAHSRSSAARRPCLD